MRNCLFSWNRDVLVDSELVLERYALGVIVDDPIFVFGSGLVLGHLE